MGKKPKTTNIHRPPEKVSKLLHEGYHNYYSKPYTQKTVVCKECDSYVVDHKSKKKSERIYCKDHIAITKMRDICGI